MQQKIEYLNYLAITFHNMTTNTTEELEEIYAGLPPAIVDEPDDRDYLISELG